MTEHPDFIPTDFTGFDRYIRQGEPDQKERAANWAMAIGLQAVDGLHVSEYLKQTALSNIEGKITIDEAQKLVANYYTTQDGRQSVNYLNYEDLRKALDYDINEEKMFSYSGISNDDLVEHITKFVAGIWQIHPFPEGNTRTTAVFTIQYLRSIGFDIDNNLFANNSWYFRNALVRANYKNATLGID